MTEVAAVDRRATLGAWIAGIRRTVSRVAVASAARVRAEGHAFLAAPKAGAFHGEPHRADGYLTIVRTTWGRP